MINMPIRVESANLPAAPALHELQVHCGSCNLRELCLPVGLSPEDLVKLDDTVSRKRILRGQNLYHDADPFTALYAVRFGFFKTRVNTVDGRDQVTGFFMAGEIVGMDGIGTEKHTVDAIALEDSEVCTLPFAKLETLSREIDGLQKQLHRVMSREIVREHGVMMLLGSMRAEERLAAFLMNLTQRMHARGFSATELVLRMTREEIGSYLGLKLETISRTFSKFQDDGLIEVKQRHVKVLDPAGLSAMFSVGSSYC
jgi:CRP/FNR family transcriptional regulator